MTPLRPETSLAWSHHSVSRSFIRFTTTRPVAAFGG